MKIAIFMKLCMENSFAKLIMMHYIQFANFIGKFKIITNDRNFNGFKSIFCIMRKKSANFDFKLMVFDSDGIFDEIGNWLGFSSVGKLMFGNHQQISQS